ncbi:homoserine kinase [Solwaraspora sp. WMMD1047]|uniref:homoserine kinase n=1 Tax=Solwaraspora sp. WMMD1047 TaxID=3016102 RepID=UPI00241656BA|nr:homoserine kinase [Solwaraspora sp. WMMD1047]MDG4828779.1 homoserine kinase [Solwaraspora sp. WMMD1047]
MPLTFGSEPVRVRVPATSANLGPGFDAFGLALTLHDEVEARVTGADGTRVAVSGEGAGELPTGEDHLVVRAMRATFDALGGQPGGLDVRCDNRIPQARGMGSSSAAIVAGVLLARALVDDGDRLLDVAAVLRLAAELEGHPDNVAPCLLGGFTIAWMGAGGTADDSGAEGAPGADSRVSDGAEPAHAVRLAVAPHLRPTVYVPAVQGLTSAARAALPATVPHADAARNAGRAALLVHALTTDPGLLLTATEDRLHQGYRAAGMPESAALLTSLRTAGVAAVISGAGPSVLALTEPPADFGPGMGWTVKSLSIDGTGAQVVGGKLGHAERDPVAAGRKS